MDQARICLDHLDGMLARNPTLGAMFSRRGNERIAQGGSRVRVIASDAPTAWGLGGTHRRFRVIADELTVWGERGEELWSALASSTGKVADAQMIVLSNAGFEKGRSWQWRIRELARKQPWARLYAPEGIIASWVTPEWIDQQRALLPPIAFERVIQNRWTISGGDFCSEDAWERCIDPHLPYPPHKGTRYLAGLDLGLVKDRTAFSIVHRAGQHICLDQLDTWQGSRGDPVSITAVEHALIGATTRYNHSLSIYADPWQLKGSIERLQPRGVQIREFTFSQASVQKLSASLLHAITSNTLRVFPDDDLTAEVLGLRVVESPSGWKMDHRSHGYSDRAVSLAIAIHHVAPQHLRGIATRPKGRLFQDGIKHISQQTGLTIYHPGAHAEGEYAQRRLKQLLK